jgi:hypothetical protein
VIGLELESGDLVWGRGWVVEVRYLVGFLWFGRCLGRRVCNPWTPALPQVSWVENTRGGGVARFFSPRGEKNPVFRCFGYGCAARCFGEEGKERCGAAGSCSLRAVGDKWADRAGSALPLYRNTGSPSTGKSLKMWELDGRCCGAFGCLRRGESVGGERAYPWHLAPLAGSGRTEAGSALPVHRNTETPAVRMVWRC